MIAVPTALKRTSCGYLWDAIGFDWTAVFDTVGMKIDPCSHSHSSMSLIVRTDS